MLRGTSKLTVDAKGRLSLPARYKSLFAEDEQHIFVITVDKERCLLIYPIRNWELVEKRIENLPNLNPEIRQYQRLILGYAHEVELDKNNRILISKELRDFASISKKAVLTGQGRKFELWDDALWDQKMNNWLEKSVNEIPEDLKNLTI
jgi:MraZ protein